MSDIVLANEKSKLFTVLSGYANAISNLTDEQVPEAFEMTDNLKTLADEVRDRLRDRLLGWVQRAGEVVTEKGSMAGSTGGFKVTAIPTRTGVDPKKLEALLRRLKLDPVICMDQTVAYKVNNDKITTALIKGQLTVEDVASCNYDKSFRVQVEHE
jgi:hypothetical protein